MRIWHLLVLVAAFAMAATLMRSPPGLTILALIANFGIAVTLFGLLDGTMTGLSRRASRGDRVARCEKIAIASLVVIGSIAMTLMSILALTLFARAVRGWAS